MGFSAEKKVGVVFFLGVAILIAFTLLLTDINVFNRYYTVDVIFQTVGGLKPGDKVTVGGMEIGEVRKLVLREGKIRVTLAVDAGNLFPADSSFKIVDTGMLGGKAVNIVWGAGTAMIQPGTTVNGLPTQGLSEALSSLGEAGDKVQDIMESTRSVAQKIDQGQGTIGKLVNEDELYQDAKATIAELKAIVEENRKQIQEIVEQVRSSVPRLKKTLENIEEISDKINRGEGTVGKLINEPEFYEEAQVTMASLQEAGDKINDFMAKTSQVRVWLGAEAAYNTRNERMVGKAGLQVEPVPSRMYRVAVAMLTGPGTEADTKDDVDTEFDAQIGFRFFDNRLTLRGGMLEGHVGGGIDLRLYERSLIFTVEGRTVWKHEKDEGISPFLLRAYLDAHLLWGFFLRAGVDNIVDEPGFYCGGGLFIEEEHILTFFGLMMATN